MVSKQGNSTSFVVQNSSLSFSKHFFAIGSAFVMKMSSDIFSGNQAYEDSAIETLVTLEIKHFIGILRGGITKQLLLYPGRIFP